MIPNYLSLILQQAIGHFFKGWKEDSAPAILNPWKYGYTNDRSFDLYSEWSEFLLDREFGIMDALDNGAGYDFWYNLEAEAQHLIEQYA
jgi:hypothetical protein